MIGQNVPDCFYDGGLDNWITDLYQTTKAKVTGWIGGVAKATVTPTAGVSTDGRPLPVTITPAAPVVYTVKRGDTLSGIARAYGCTLAQLRSWNPQIPNINNIAVGQRVNINEMVARPTTAVSVGTSPAATGMQTDAAVAVPTFDVASGVLYTPAPAAIQYTGTPGSAPVPVAGGGYTYTGAPAAPAGGGIMALLDNPVVLGAGALLLVLLLKGKGKK